MVERIVVDPKVLKGKPVIRGTRIPVYLILELLAAGMSVEDVLKEYPELREEDVRAALDYASKLLKQEVILPLEA
ncbi:MAG: antitoxin [Thermoprotei archaeon]|nr:MAG: antitoxin [Thermoprotei archaeon]